MEDIKPLLQIDLQESALKYKKYVETINYRIKNHQVPHNKKYKQGFYIPKHPLKCMNIIETPEPQPIIWRSSWEADFCKFCDETKSVTRWGSEILKILYKDPIRNKMAFYIPDFYVEYIDESKKLRKVIIEIKPLKEAVLNETKNGYDKLVWARNTMKWKAALQFAQKRGIEFKVLHEHNLGIS